EGTPCQFRVHVPSVLEATDPWRELAKQLLNWPEELDARDPQLLEEIRPARIVEQAHQTTQVVHELVTRIGHHAENRNNSRGQPKCARYSKTQAKSVAMASKL